MKVRRGIATPKKKGRTRRPFLVDQAETARLLAAGGRQVLCRNRGLAGLAVPLDTAATGDGREGQHVAGDRLVRFVAERGLDDAVGAIDLGNVLASDRSGLGQTGGAIIRRELATIVVELGDGGLHAIGEHRALGHL